MAWFKYLKSTESINSSTTNSNYSYPYCKRFIGRFTPRDTLEANTWIFASILDININTYKDTSLENQTDETSYVVTYEKGDNVYPVETVIEGNYLYFKTHEIHTAAEEITGQYAVYYNTPNLRKINEVDNGGVEDYQVNLAPVWEDLELAPFIYGDSYLDGPSAIGTVYSISSGALPTGLSISSSTGQITGTVNSSGAYSFTARATTDDGKYYNEATFSGTVYEYLEWVDSTLANIDYNTAYSDSVWADGYPAATYSISSGELPLGITLNSATGLVSGTTLDSGAYSFTIKAENAIGSITQSFSGTVQSPPSWSDQTLGAIIQGVAYSDGVSATGTATITYSVYSGSLPSGLSLNSSTGAITGTTGSTGSYNFTIRATNTWGHISKAFTEGIYTTPAWTDSTIANMIYGQAYSDAVAASGYPAVTYSISTGALPSGITLNSSTGAIAGTSTTAGSYSFTVKAENAVSNVTQLFTDDLYVTPAWTDNTLVAFTYNTAYSDQVVATGTPTYTISSGTLPTGLSLNSSTGAVTGTPTYYGAYSFTVQAANETGSVTQSFSGAIDRTPSWTDNTLANINYNIAYSDSVAAIGYPTITYSISSGALPTGISLNTSTGAVTGTSTQSGSYSFTIRAENTAGNVTQSFSGTIQTPPSWSDETLGIITQGVAYSDGVSATGTATIVYSVYSGSLPSGLSLNSSTGAITGTTGSTGSYNFTIRATNTWGYVEKAFSETIYQIPAWTDSTIANMIYGQAYSDAVAASGYPAVTYSISTGALPSGITLNSSTGAITGTSTTAGSYSFTVRAENAAGNVTQLFTDDLYVTPAWTDNTLAAFTYNTAYSDQVVATGSPTYTISSGTLPTGLSLNSSTGAVTGTPTYYGAYSFTVQAANETGSVTQSFSGAIYAAPFWTDSTLATPTYDVAYSDSVIAGGYPAPYYKIETGACPLSLNIGTGEISGTYTAPRNNSSFTYNFTVRAYNQIDPSQYVDQAFTWVVTIPFVATGGTITTSGGYKVHTFTSSGSFVVQSGTKSVEYIVVGGGGGGGGNPGAGTVWGGGGGAGGLRTGSSTYVAQYASSNGFQVIVGGGGAVDAYGSYSLIYTPSSYILSNGGGLGGGWNYSAQNGGSGGGGWANGNTTGGSGGSGTSGEGNNGGSGASAGAGGGGGKTAVGANGSGETGGNGGSGQTFTWGSSLDGYFAGGGGGAGFFYSGSGGSSVGGYGAILSYYTLEYNYPVQIAGSATINRGGGGGGSASAYQYGYGFVQSVSGSAGSSGAVIVRYLE